MKLPFLLTLSARAYYRLFWLWLRRCPICPSHPKLDHSFDLRHAGGRVMECLSCRCGSYGTYHEPDNRGYYMVGVRNVLADLRRRRAIRDARAGP